MVRRLTTDGDGIAVVVGAAGTGKTFALDAARLAWEHDGYTVIGCALAARAAAELQAGAGIRSTTIAGLLSELDQPGAMLRQEPWSSSTKPRWSGPARCDASPSTRAAPTRSSSSSAITTNSPKSRPAAPSARSLVGSGRSRSPRTAGNETPSSASALTQLREGNAHDAVERLSEHGRIISCLNSEETRAADGARLARRQTARRRRDHARAASHRRRRPQRTGAQPSPDRRDDRRRQARSRRPGVRRRRCCYRPEERSAHRIAQRRTRSGGRDRRRCAHDERRHRHRPRGGATPRTSTPVGSITRTR